MNDLDIVKKLLDGQMVNVNEKDQLGRTPLQIACYFGLYEVCKVILENGADKDGCLDLAENGWDGYRQNKIIELLYALQNR